MIQASPYAIALSQFTPFGSRAYLELFKQFGSYEAIWKATLNELSELELASKKAAAFVAWRNQTEPQKLVHQVIALGINTIDRDSPYFPATLKTIHDPPIILYVRGSLPNTNKMVGIVGAREASEYGKRTGQKFASELARAGIVIVSGLARGIDTEAHTAAMSVGGKTIAVLAHGLEKLTADKRNFTQQILDSGGAIISEQPPYQAAEKFHFPIRNRIIAGLSQVVLIVEAKLPSGSLTTATAALENAREIFAVPGPIDSPTSEGTNKLIQDGAHVAISPNDILQTFGLSARPEPKPNLSIREIEASNTPTESIVLNKLLPTPIHVDELARTTALPTAILLATLTLLEIHGKVRNLGNMHYSL